MEAAEKMSQTGSTLAFLEFMTSGDTYPGVPQR